MIVLLEIISKNNRQIRHIGREVDMKGCIFNEGKPLKVQYKGGGYFIHENVEKLEEDDYGFWVTTATKYWNFVKVGNMNEYKGLKVTDTN